MAAWLLQPVLNRDCKPPPQLFCCCTCRRPFAAELQRGGDAKAVLVTILYLTSILKVRKVFATSAKPDGESPWRMRVQEKPNVFLVGLFGCLLLAASGQAGPNGQNGC